MPIDYQELPHAGIRSLIPYKPGKAIEELAREKGISDIIKMASNENPLGCSPLALAALRNLPALQIATYPSPVNHALQPKLANMLGVNVGHMLFSNGSDALFGTLLNCFALHTGKHILTHEYAFSSYAIQAHSLQIAVHTVKINPDWRVNIESLIKACTSHTGIIFLANPNNPTGILLQQQEIKYLLEHIPETTLLVLDEAYYEFAASQMSCNSIGWLQEHPNLIITRTFSKIYGMAGLRLGYAIGNPEIISILQRVQLPFSVNQLALTAAHAALDDDEFIQLSLELTQKGMVQIKTALDQLDLTSLASACNFLTFDCKEDSLKLYDYLLNAGIIVRPLHAYNMPNYIRVTIGTEEQNNRFIRTIRNYYTRLL